LNEREFLRCLEREAGCILRRDLSPGEHAAPALRAERAMAGQVELAVVARQRDLELLGIRGPCERGGECADGQIPVPDAVGFKLYRSTWSLAPDSRNPCFGGIDLERVQLQLVGRERGF